MSLAQNAYIDASNVYESSLENNYKKDNGVFYTDLSLAEKMLTELKLPKDAIIMDPCCGSGVFLYAAKKHGFINLFGADQDKNAIATAKERLAEYSDRVKFVHSNFENIKSELEKKSILNSYKILHKKCVAVNNTIL